MQHLTNLKLDHHLGECDGHLVHELVHKLVHFLFGNSPLPQTQIERVIKEGLVVGTDVQADGYSGLRKDTCDDD